MINGINASSPHIQVTGGESSGMYYNTSGMSAGMVRYYNNGFQVYDGMTWLTIANNYASVGLTASANDAINWAIQKMQEDRELQELAKKHPSVKAAYESVQRAQEQLKTTIILSKDESTTS